MARNTGKDSRKGAVSERSQSFNSATGQWVKRDTTTGKFIATKKDGEPFKGVRKEPRKIRVSPGIDPKEVKELANQIRELQKKLRKA